MSNTGSGVLLRDQIESRGIIAEEAEESSFQPASYDLRVGDAWVPTYKGEQEGAITRFNGKQIVVPAFGSLIVSTHEVLKLPLDVVGKFNLRIKLALKGLFVQMGTQVEPGYYGRLFAVLNNITEEDIELPIEHKDGKLERERLFTVEFFTTIGAAPALEKHKTPVLELNDWVKTSNFAKSSISSVVKKVDKLEAELKEQDKRIVGQQDAVLSRVQGEFGGRLDLLKTEWDSRKDVNSAREDLFAEKAAGLDKRYEAALSDIAALDARLSGDVQKIQDTKMQFVYTLGGAGIFLIFMSALVPFIFSYALDQSNSWWERGTVETYKSELQSIEGQLDDLRTGSARTDVVDSLLGEVRDLQSAIVELEAKIDYLETRPGVEGSPSPGEN